MQGWWCVPAKVSGAKRMMDWWGNGKTQAHSGSLPRQWSMYLHIINVMRRLEPPSLDVSFSTYLLCTNYQAGLFPRIEKKNCSLPLHWQFTQSIEWTSPSAAHRLFCFLSSLQGLLRLPLWGVDGSHPASCDAWTGSSVPVILVVAQCVGCFWSNTGKSNWEMKNFSAQWCSYPEKQRQRCGWGWWSLCCWWLWVRAGSHTVQQTAWGGLVTLWTSTESSCPWEWPAGSAHFMS